MVLQFMSWALIKTPAWFFFYSVELNYSEFIYFDLKEGHNNSSENFKILCSIILFVFIYLDVS